MSDSRNPYNNYPEGFLEPFTEPVVFRLIDKYRQPDPDNAKGILMPFIMNIPATSRITLGDKVIDLALIRNIDSFGEVELEREALFIGKVNNGMFQLSPNNPAHRKMFNYLNHCSYNKDSKYTYAGADVYIERYSPEKDAKQNMIDRSAKKAAILIVDSLNDAESRSLYAKIGTKNPTRISIEEMKDELDALAFVSPEIIIDAHEPRKAKKEAQAVSAVSVQEVPFNEDLEVEFTSTSSDEDEETLDDEDIISAEDLVNIVTKSKQIYKHNPTRKWKMKRNGFAIFNFEPASKGVGTAEEQLIDAIDKDKNLRGTMESLATTRS
jgi:hypothetical protein